MNTLNEYESQQFNKIIKWENEEPSVVSKAMGTVTKPIAWAVNMIIPQSAIQGALTGCNKIAELCADEGDILRDAGVNSIEELRSKDLQLSDGLADSVHNWAVAVATTEGAATGIIGLPGMAVDIPAIITFALRSIHKIALCYGYKSTTQEEQNFVYQIMSLAGANSVQEKTLAIMSLKALQVMLVKQTWKKMTEKAAQNMMGKEFFAISVKSLAKQLGINITKRKVLQAIPIFGGAVSGAMNATFINDVCWAARRTYQKRWLADQNKIELD